MRRRTWIQRVWRVLAVYLVGAACGPFAARADESDVTLGLHIGTDIFAEFDYQTGAWRELAEWQDTVTRNFDWMRKQGYDTLLLDVMSTEDYYFSSPLLKRKGYHFHTDALGHFISQGHAHNIRVFADVTILAWRLDRWNQERYHIPGEPLSVSEVQEVIATLLDDYGVDGIIEETYTAPYVAGIHDVCQQRGRPYIHKFDEPNERWDALMSEDYVGYLDSAAARKRLDDIGAAGNNVGLFNGLFAHAATLNRPAHVKVYGGWDFSPGASRNVLLFRAAQFQPRGYFWMSFGDDPNYAWLKAMDTNDLRSWLAHLRTPAPTGRPIANICIMPPGAGTDREDWEEVAFLFQSQSLGAVSNGLQLAGYDLRLTYNRPLPDAALIVLGLPGAGDELWRDLPATVQSVFEGPRPCIVVPMLGLSSRGRWKKALPHLGVRADWSPALLDDMPTLATVAGTRMRWRGMSLWDFPAITSRLRPEDVTGTVLVEGRVGRNAVALVCRKGNVTLINGNLLNLETSYLFARLAAEARGTNAPLEVPYYGYGVVGTRSAFLAMGDTPLRVNLRQDDGSAVPDGAPLRVIRFGADGGLASDTRVPYHAPFSAALAKHELVIIELAGAPAPAPKPSP